MGPVHVTWWELRNGSLSRLLLNPSVTHDCRQFGLLTLIFCFRVGGSCGPLKTFSQSASRSNPAYALSFGRWPSVCFWMYWSRQKKNH